MRRGIDPATGRVGYRVRLPSEEREILAARSPPSCARRSAPRARRYTGFSRRRSSTTTRATWSTASLVGAGLLEGKLAALHELERTAHAESLTGRAPRTWLGGIESLRLVLGTQLDVTEESYGPASTATTPMRHGSPSTTGSLCGCRRRSCTRSPNRSGAERPRGLRVREPRERARPSTGEARLDGVVHLVERERRPDRRAARSRRPAPTCSSITGSASAGSSEPYSVPVSRFSLRISSNGSRSSRSPLRRQPHDHRGAAVARGAEGRLGRRGVADRVEPVVGAVRERGPPSGRDSSSGPATCVAPCAPVRRRARPRPGRRRRSSPLRRSERPGRRTADAARADHEHRQRQADAPAA